MKVVDEAIWQLQCAELEAEGEVGQSFRQFVETWVDLADEMMWEGTGGQSEPQPNISAAEAIREAIGLAEYQLGRGRVDIGSIGSMLVAIATYWEHGLAMMKDFTPIETRLVQDSLTMKIMAMQQGAAESGDEPPDTT
ncbi:hypothetical protein [Mycolicibacterium tusciae]|uniref:hypothetical protein n=1 Tax=Mycolicibacterium tusciae TaxID=75922 RepID=UPI00024A2986|nr:hypothetical protein [Mycolicibacterium tusciae]